MYQYIEDWATDKLKELLEDYDECLDVCRDTYAHHMQQDAEDNLLNNVTKYMAVIEACKLIRRKGL